MYRHHSESKSIDFFVNSLHIRCIELLCYIFSNQQ